jgi:transcriptional regulator with XRE-family HTH domain
MKRKTSLKELAKELGVSASYLSQIKHGKRPASQKVLSNSSFKKLSGVKQKIKHDVDVNMSKSYNLILGQRSSVVEQRTHKPLVAGSNPAAATFFYIHARVLKSI